MTRDQLYFICLLSGFLLLAAGALYVIVLA